MRTDFLSQRDPGDENDMKRQIVRYDGRLNTGLVKNGDDWTGVFIRGDEVKFEQWDSMLNMVMKEIDNGNLVEAGFLTYLTRRSMSKFVVLDEESQDK